jgi:hypothetical protein
MGPKRAGRARPTVELYLVMYEGFPFQHWAIFIDDPNDRTMVHIQGSFMTGWTFEEKHGCYPPENSAAFVAKHHIATIYKDQVDDLIAIAQRIPLTGQTNAWDCQHWVIEVLRRLNEDDIIALSDEAFRGFRHRVESIQWQ